jgi:hypothetical protein
VGLPGSAEGVMKALAQQPRGGASLLALPLESAILDATVYLRENPTRRVQLAAVFDGESDFRPCADDTLDRAVSMATAGYTSSPPIRSTIIGIGSQLVDLHKVAIAGGTDQARLITVQGVADATHEIAYALRAAATPCEIAIPDGARTPGAFDPTRLNVETMLATVAQRRIQYQVAGASSCEQSNQRDGWYYDDPSKPAKVVFCPATCASLGFDDDPGVSFLVGCPTKPRPPPN